MKEKTNNIISYILLALVFFGIGASIVHHASKISNTKENIQQQSQYLQEMDTLVLYTSVEEAESLIADLDTIYSRYSNEEKID